MLDNIAKTDRFCIAHAQGAAMDQEQWEAELHTIGKIIREMLILAETHGAENDMTKKIAELRDKLSEAVKRFNDSGTRLFVNSVRAIIGDDEPALVRKVELMEFRWGPERQDSVTLDAGIILDNTAEPPTVTNGHIVISSKIRPHSCKSCRDITTKEYEERNEAEIDNLVTHLGFPNLAKFPIWIFEEDERHALEAALNRHWDSLYDEFRRREDPLSRKNLLRAIHTDEAYDPDRYERAAFEFILKRELAELENLAHVHILSPCLCEMQVHQTALLRWKERSGP